jgi:hypothetical protein
MPDVREALDAAFFSYKNICSFDGIGWIVNGLRTVYDEQAKNRDRNSEPDFEELRETRDEVTSATAKYHIQARGVRFFEYSVKKNSWEHKDHFCRAVILLVRACPALPILRGHEKHILFPMMEAGHIFVICLIKEEVPRKRAKNRSHLANRRERDAVEEDEPAIHEMADGDRFYHPNFKFRGTFTYEKEENPGGLYTPKEHSWL